MNHPGAIRQARKTSYICIGVAATTLAISSPAKALTFNWSFVNNSGSPLTGGTVSGTISGLSEGVNDLNTLAGVTLTVNTAQNTTPKTYTSDGNVGIFSNGFVTVSGSSVTEYNITFDDSVDWFVAVNMPSVPGFSTFALQSLSNQCVLSPASPCDRYNGPDNIFGSAVNPVPGPLPILGASAAFGWSRRLRKRIGISKT